MLNLKELIKENFYAGMDDEEINDVSDNPTDDDVPESSLWDPLGPLMLFFYYIFIGVIAYLIFLRNMAIQNFI